MMDGSLGFEILLLLVISAVGLSVFEWLRLPAIVGFLVVGALFLASRVCLSLTLCGFLTISARLLARCFPLALLLCQTFFHFFASFFFKSALRQIYSE